MKGCSELWDSCVSLSASCSSGLFTDHADPQWSRTRHGMGVLEGNLCLWKRLILCSGVLVEMPWHGMQTRHWNACCV